MADIPGCDAPSTRGVVTDGGAIHGGLPDGKKIELVLTLPCTCSAEPSSPPWRQPGFQPPPSPPPHLRFSWRIPMDTPCRRYGRHRPLTLYPGGVLGRPMRLIIATTRDEPIDMIAGGRADFAYLGPTPNVRARAKVEILAGEAESGQAGMTFRALSEYFPARHTRALNPGERGINPATMAWQVRYDWPGNAREMGIDPSTLWRKLKDEGDG